MGKGFAPTWLRQVSPLLHTTILTTAPTTYTQGGICQGDGGRVFTEFRGMVGLLWPICANATATPLVACDHGRS